MCEILGRIVSFRLRDMKASVADKKQDFGLWESMIRPTISF